MVELGYTIVTVNFRGSLGYGEKQLQSLPGNAGTYDVTDCIAALDYCIEKGTILSDNWLFHLSKYSETSKYTFALCSNN